MTRLEALKALADKVEAGDLTYDYCIAQHVHGIGMNGAMWRAYTGSLDEAKALHEAVLPGWPTWQVLQRSEWVDVVLHGPRTGYKGYQNMAAKVDRRDAIQCPARAWLLSILRALIEQEEAEE